MRKKRGWVALLGLAILILHSQSYGQIQITSPVNGDVVNPGQTITIVISADPSVQILGIMAQDPLGDPQPTASSNQLTLTIPATISPGLYSLRAEGLLSNNGVESAPVTIDVERPDDPVQIRIEPAIIRFRRPGQKIPLRVVGTFSDGSLIDITASTKTNYLSNGSQVATVDPGGIVSSLSDGSTTITVRAGSADFSIPIRVPLPPTRVINAFSGSGQTTIQGQLFSQPLVAQVNDSGGAPVSGASVSFIGPISGAGVTFPNGNTAISNASGQAQIAVVANGNVGSNYVVRANTANANNSAVFVLGNLALPPDFQIGGQSNSVTVIAGQSGSLALTISPAGGLQGSVNFSCSGLPVFSACQFQPNPVVLTGNNSPVQTMLTITTTHGSLAKANAAGISGQSQPLRSYPFAICIWLVFWLGAALLLGNQIINSRVFPGTCYLRMRIDWSKLVLIAMLLLAVFSMISCGSGSSTPPNQPGTPAGTFAVTVSGTSNGLTRNFVVTLKVQ